MADNPYAKYAGSDNPYSRFAAKPATPQAPLKIGAEGFQDAMRSELSSRSGLEKALAGAGTVIDDAALRLQQLVTGETDKTQTVANREIRRDPFGMGGAVLGGVGAFGPMGVTSVLGNAALGSGIGFFGQPVLEGESGAVNAVGGGAAGAAGAVLGKVLTGSPIFEQSAQTQRLLKDGVVPTVGQNAASSGGMRGKMFGNIEERATSVPVIGDFITNARKRALSEFNQAAIKRATPAGESVAAIGKEGVDDAINATKTAFENVYAGTKTGPTVQLAQDIAAAKQKPAIGLTAEASKKFDTLIDRLVWQRLQPGTDAGLVKKTIESDLGKEARTLMFSGNSDDRALGEAVKAARDSIRDALNRSLNDTTKSGKLPALNQAYAAGKTLEKAAERASASGGVFTPYQLQKAAGATGPLRGLADDAQAVLASRVPNSGTADRVLQAALMNPSQINTGTLGYIAGAGLMSPFYSRIGSRFLLGDLTPELVQQSAPYITQGARGVLSVR